MTVPSEIHLRSYESNVGLEAHGYAQLVLPVSGTLEMEIGGRSGRLDDRVCAFVAAETMHDQVGPRGNRSIIVDVPTHMLSPHARDILSERVYLPLDAAALHLRDYMAFLRTREKPSHTIIDGWLTLLHTALAPEPPVCSNRLQKLRMEIEREPFRSWRVADMAVEAKMSESSLHRAFHVETGKSPHSWLAEIRMRQIRALIETTQIPLSEIALRTGFSDQTAMTRAVRTSLGITPAQLRRNI